MGKHKDTTLWGADAQKSTSHTLSSRRSKANDTDDAVYDLRDDEESLEEKNVTDGCFL